MASKSNNKESKKSPAAPRRSRKSNNISLHSAQQDQITVVGIGASAGGLKTLQAFFEALSSNTGMAYVVITHLHPEHESHLAELLQRYTRMPVQQVTGLVPTERDHVYVIPPNRRLVMEDSQIDAAEFKEPRGQRAPIDYFFRSLAHGHPNSIGIILSGSGTDGAVGVKAIKEEGGLLMVQHPDEAEYNSMPNAAIATGLADIVLPVKELAAKLMEYIQFRPRLPLDAEELTEGQLEVIRRIIAHVHTRTGHDFSQYKRSTLLRRIQRRMQIYGISTLELYLDTLRQNPAEATALFNDILIGVTSFFRDREAWEQLATDVIPQILREKETGETVRAWTIGCSTGEEAYGLAILLMEGFNKQAMLPQIQVFASDLDENSIRFAREGLYPAAIEADVSAERLDRFFTPEGDHYRVRPEVREVVLFTHHSVLRDAPFSRLDLISCRNLLIYLERDIQNAVFDIFHYALKTGRYLFLGNAESVESAHELFQTVDKTHRIYRTKPWNREQPHIPSLPLSIGPHTYTELYSQPYAHRLHSTLEFSRLSNEYSQSLEAHAPPSVLINEKYAVLYVSETAGRYLLQPSGPITTDLLMLVRPELQLELRTALMQVFEKDQAVLTPPIPVQFNGRPHRVILSIQPRTDKTGKAKNQEKQALVFFLEDEQDEPDLQAAQDETDKNTLVRRLENEVRRLREQLQASLEEYQSSNEALKASNEELQSINEEHRSATEELETGKEELQSVNEELQTVNSELLSKLEEISRAHSDLENLMNATEVAMLFLDRELRIRHYTPGMRDLFNIMPGDRGRPIRHLTHTLRYTQFFEDAEDVLRTLIPIEREVQGEAGGWFLLRMRPYRTLEDRIEGVIFTFVEITHLKQAEEQLREMAAKLTGTEQAERHRLSQVLHDDLQQRLFAVQMQLSFLRDAYEKNDLQAFPVDFQQIEEWLAESIRVTRQLSVDLSPPILHGEGLLEAVIWLAAQMNEQYGLKVDIKSKGTPAELEEKIRVLIFYAVRELLFNIVKHAEVSEAAVRFEHKDSHLFVIVKDQGAGFDSLEVMNNPKMAHGLLTIRDRLDLLGCKLTVKSHPGNGTEAIIEVPYGQMDT